VEATGELLAAIRERRSRSIGVGRADERWFTCAAGVGFDAEVVRAVEQRRADGHAATPWLYVRAAVHQFLAESDRRHPALRLVRPDEPPVEPLAMAIVSNTAPWTYFGSRPVQPSPEASFETGLDVMAMRRLRTGATLRAVRRMLISGAEPPQGRHVLRMHDLPEFALKCQRPMAVQVDGDYVGERESVTFRAYRDALRVVV
jgi:diacylglycerol kinase family enzyme